MSLLFWGATQQEPYAILRQAVGVKASYACVVRTLELDTSSGVASMPPPPTASIVTGQRLCCRDPLTLTSDRRQAIDF